MPLSNLPSLIATPRARRFAVASCGIPLFAVAISVIAQLIVWSSLPDQIAVHWSLDGAPDGWGSPGLILSLTLILGLLITVGLTASSLPDLRAGYEGQSFRLIAIMSSGIVTFLVTMLGTIIVAQADGGTASPSAAIGLGGLAALAAGTASWFIVPAPLPVPAPPAAATGLTLSPHERIVWLQTETASRGVIAIGLTTIVLSIVAVAATWTTGTGLVALIAPAVILLVAAFAVSSMLAFRVRIDESGLKVRSVIGVPWFTVPASEIVSVTPIEVRAIGDFGGYGFRLAKGRFGVILRSGPAIEIARANRRPFVLTVSDNARAAAVLATVANASIERQD